MELMRPRRLVRLAALAVIAVGPPIGHLELIDSAWAEAARAAGRSSRAAREQTTLPRPRPAAVGVHEAEAGDDAEPPALPESFRELARGAGEPQIPGLTIVYLHPLGLPADANNWRNIIVHQTEGPAGSAKSMALEQAKNPTKRGVMVWVETDGTVYWATAETAIPTHGDGANRNDNKYVDNSKTYRNVIKTNSIGVEFVGNYPDVAKPAPRAIRSRCRARGPLPSAPRKQKPVTTRTRPRSQKAFASSPEGLASRRSRGSPSSSCIRSARGPKPTTGATSSCTRPKGPPARRKAWRWRRRKIPPSAA